MEDVAHLLVGDDVWERRAGVYTHTRAHTRQRARDVRALASMPLDMKLKLAFF